MEETVLLLGSDLSPDMKIFLANRLEYRSDTACARALGLNEDTPMLWRRRSPAFKEAYAAIATEVLQNARVAAMMAAEEAANTLAEALGFKAKDALEVKERNTHLRAAELLLKANGMMDNATLNVGNIVGLTADDLARVSARVINQERDRRETPGS